MEQYFLRPTAGGEPSGEGVILVRAADPYEEIAAVAASICEDVRRRGLRYKEIAVICRDLAPYRIALERTFGKYGIPFFADLPQGAADTPAVSAVRAALDCAAEGFTAGNILRFAKAAAVGIDPEAAAELENYCYVWNVGRRDWQKPFENHPGGFQAEFSPEDTARLERINGVRSRVILPLERFRRELREADGPGFSTAVYHLLESIGAGGPYRSSLPCRRTGGGTAAAAGRTGPGLGGADEPAGHPGGGDRPPAAAAAGAGKPL